MHKPPRRRRGGPPHESTFIIERPWKEPSRSPPNDLPTYRLITGKDDAIFCQRVSEALKLGYRLHGSPAVTFNGIDIIAAQSVIWPFIEENSHILDENDDIPF